MLAISRAEVTTACCAERPLNGCAPRAPRSPSSSTSSNAMVRLIGVDPDTLEKQHTAEDLKQIIDTSRVGGHLDPGEAVMRTRVFTSTSRRRER